MTQFEHQAILATKEAQHRLQRLLDDGYRITGVIASKPGAGTLAVMSDGHMSSLPSFLPEVEK